jgi:hypothetical protein
MLLTRLLALFLGIIPGSLVAVRRRDKIIENARAKLPTYTSHPLFVNSLEGGMCGGTMKRNTPQLATVRAMVRANCRTLGPNIIRPPL